MNIGKLSIHAYGIRCGYEPMDRTIWVAIPLPRCRFQRYPAGSSIAWNLELGWLEMCWWRDTELPF